VDLAKAQEAKRQLERDIAERLTAFQKATGLHVNDLVILHVEVNSLEGPATRLIHSVTAEVKL
jgi:hypothetical protein